MAENNNRRVHDHTNYPLDASGRTPDPKTFDEAHNEPTRLKVIAEEYWKAFKRPPPVYTAINPVLDQIIEERGLPSKAGLDDEEQARIRSQGTGALASAYTEIIIRQHQRRYGVMDSNYEASMQDHSRFVMTTRAVTGGIYRDDLGPGGFQPVQEFPTFTNSAASSNALLDVQKQIQESMFTEAFQNCYGTLAEHIESLKSKTGQIFSQITAQTPLHVHEQLAELKARYERSRQSTYDAWKAEQSRNPNSPLMTMRSHVDDFMRANAFNAEKQIDLHLGWLGRRTVQGMDDHIAKIIDFYKGRVVEDTKRDFVRDHQQAFEGTPEAREAAKRALNEKLNKLGSVWDKLKQESQTSPQAFEQRIVDQLARGNRNPMTVALMNAVSLRRDLDKDLDVFTQQERLRLLKEASMRAGRDLPRWFAKAEQEAAIAVQDKALRNAFDRDFRRFHDPAMKDLKFGDYARGSTTFESLTDKSMFRGSGLQLPNALRPPKPTIMPKMTHQPKAVAPKPTPAVQESGKPKRPSISAFASSVVDTLKKGIGSIKR